MWFRSLLAMLTPARSVDRTSRGKKAARRREARRLLFEPLDARRVLAFAPFDDSTIGLSYSRVDVTGDFTSDGLTDLVVGNGSSLKLFVATGDGEFAAPATLALTGSSIAAGHLNGDTYLDLVTNLGISLGNGNGSFQAPTAFSLPPMIPTGYHSPVAQSPGSVAVGDINGDGKLDLAVTGRTWVSVYYGRGAYGEPLYHTYTSGHVNVLLGNGAGTVQPAIVSNFPQQNYNEATALAQLSDDDVDGDVDVDDHLDLVVKPRDSWGGSSFTLLGDGNGSFGPATYVQSQVADKVVLGDFDEDGQLDLVSHTTTDVRINRGLPGGGFAAATEVELAGPPAIPRSVAVGDINGDGKLDIAVTTQRLYIQGYGYYDNPYPYYGWGSGTVHDGVKVILGNGDGTFKAPITSQLGVHEGFSGLSIHSSQLADVDGDDRLDLALIDGYQGRLTVALNDGIWVPPAALYIDDAEVVEGDGGQQLVVFTVRSVGALGPVSVAWETQDNTATAGQDYTATSGSLSFGPGDSSDTFSVPVLGDRSGELTELFIAVLSNPSGAILVDGQAIGTIVDNEPTVSINHSYWIDPLTVVEGDSGTTPAVFTVTLSAPYDEEVAVDYYTSTGHTNDIISVADTVRFAPGETSKDIAIQVVGDLIDEPLEAFNIYLTNSPKAYIVSGAGYCYIQDNDPSPSVTISDVSKKEGNKGTTRFDFTLTLSAPAGNSVWVSYSTANGTATEGQDYVAEWGTVYFATGQTTATISIDVKGEKTKEPNETFFVNLSSNSLVVIADGQGQGTVLDDDSSNPGKGPGQGHGNPNGTAAKTIPAKNSATSSGARSSSTIDSALAAWLAGTFTSPRRRK
jgi:hypothetical protein